MSSSAGQLNHRRAAVIGAGPAGLVTAKILKDEGFAVTIFEKGSAVGGTWVYDNDNGRNYLYRSLHINTSRTLTAFQGLPFDAATQRIPDHRDMARYLAAYADHFGLRALARFRAEVTELRPAAGGVNGPRWTVATVDGGEENFHVAVVCTGPFSRPAHVEELNGGFTGTYLHASAYRAPEPFVGKRICIVGAGNSGVDIASDVCTTAARTVLVARSPVFIMPHTVFGLSIGDIKARYLQHRLLPAAFGRRVLGWLVRAVHGRMTSHGFKPATHRVHPTISSTIVQDILFERVGVKQGIAGIDGQNVAFVDGTSETFDCLIAATGFVSEFPFLSQDVVPTPGHRLELYKRIVPPDRPGLYFVGMIALDTPINYACERQAQWIAEIERGGVALPDADEMRADIAAKRRWVADEFGPSMRHSLQEDSVRYYGELARALRQGRRRHAAHPRRATRAAASDLRDRPGPPHATLPLSQPTSRRSLP